MPLFPRRPKIKVHHCEGGVTLEVPLEDDDALSTYLPDKKISGGGKFAFVDQISVEGNAEYQTTLKSVSDIYNERNTNILIEFKIHYKMFRLSPCYRYKDFFRQIDDILERRTKLEDYRLGILALAPLFKSETPPEVIREKISALESEFLQTREDEFRKTVNERIHRVENKQLEWRAPS